jgi:hypothetical protein
MELTELVNVRKRYREVRASERLSVVVVSPSYRAYLKVKVVISKERRGYQRCCGIPNLESAQRCRVPLSRHSSYEHIMHRISGHDLVKRCSKMKEVQE